jgi:hypothetical protein
MIGSGPGRSQFLRVSDLAADTSKTILRTEGPPEALQWCEFGSDTQLVCQYGGDVRLDGQIVAFTRLITVGVDGIDADTDSAYVLTETDGRDALFRVKLDSTKARTAVASHPKVDIDSVVRLGHGQKVVGYTYADDRRHIVYFDQDYTKLAASIGKALAGKPEIHFAGASADGSSCSSSRRETPIPANIICSIGNPSRCSKSRRSGPCSKGGGWRASNPLSFRKLTA